MQFIENKIDLRIINECMCVRMKRMCVRMCVCRREGALGIHLGAKGVPAWKSLGTTALGQQRGKQLITPVQKFFIRDMPNFHASKQELLNNSRYQLPSFYNTNSISLNLLHHRKENNTSVKVFETV